MIYCDELPFGVLSTYYYLNIDKIHIAFSYSGEDNRDWEKYFAETSNFKILCNLLCRAHYEVVNTIDPPLFYETELKHIGMGINKIMEENRVKREPFDKQFSCGEAIYYN